MIRVYITSRDGEGMVNTMEFEDLDDVRIYTSNIGESCLITLEEIGEKK